VLIAPARAGHGLFARMQDSDVVGDRLVGDEHVEAPAGAATLLGANTSRRVPLAPRARRAGGGERLGVDPPLRQIVGRQCCTRFERCAVAAVRRDR
jgi:hypothetical protein